MTEIKLTLDAPLSWVAALRAHHETTGAVVSPLSQLADRIEAQVTLLPLAAWEVDLLNLQYRRDAAVAVLEAMDVDQYLIDAVRDASPQSDGAGALPTSPSPEVGVATSPPASSPAIEEPKVWGSVVKARQGPPSNARLWAYMPNTKEEHEYIWYSEDDQWQCWKNLSDVEVLRIGIGDEKASLDESVAYSNGYEQGAANTKTEAIATGNTWRAGWAKGNTDTRERITKKLTDLKPRLITAPEQNAIDKALALIAADHGDTVVGRGHPS